MRLSATLKCVADFTKQYSNLPEAYIKRSYEQLGWRNPKGLPQYRPHEAKRKKFRFTSNRPWTEEFLRQNAPGRMRTKVFVQPIGEWTIFRGDQVQVLTGRDQGKIGVVSQVIQERNWVYVNGLNCHLRRLGADPSTGFPGALIRSEAPLLVTNQVTLVDPSDNAPTKVQWRYTEDGERVRVSIRTGRILPIPKVAQETYDYKTKATYKESTKDTSADQVSAITFSPKLSTFAMDIMKSLNIEEDRVPAKSYWY